MSERLHVVLIAEAERPALAAVFESAGDAVSRVESVADALEMTRAGGVDLVLIDLTRDDLAEDGLAKDGLATGESDGAGETASACAHLRSESGGRVPVVARAPAAPIASVAPVEPIDGGAPGADGAPEATQAAGGVGADFTFSDDGELERAAGLLRALAHSCARARRLEREIPTRIEELENLRRFTDDLVAGLPSRLFVLDEEMRVFFANRTALADTGMESTGAVGRLFTELMADAEEGSPVWSAVKGVLERKAPERLLGLRVRGLGGREESVVNVSVHPTTVAGLECARVTVDDVTDEWLAEQGRTREARTLEDIVSAMGAGIATLDRDMLFTWTNRTFAQWFGSGTGRRCSEVFLAGRCGHADCPARQALEYGTAVPETWERHTPDGRRRTFQNSFARVAASGGGDSLIVLVQDVTRQADRIEQFQLVEQLSRSIQGVHDLDELLHIILTCVTAGHALGFNRAFLFLRNRRTNTLDGRMAVGPGSPEEAHRVWAELAAQQHSLEDALSEARISPPAQSPLFRLIRDVRYPLDDLTELPARVLRERRSCLVRNAASDRRVTQDFRDRFGSTGFVAVPLVSEGEPVGVIVADNLYNNRPVDRGALALLETFAAPAGLAIGNAEAFADLKESLETLRRTRQQLIDQAKLAAVGRAAAHIAHEIRNPLAAIGGFAHSVRAHADDADRVRQNASVIYEEVLRLEKMLSDIMDFSRPSRAVPVRQSLNSVVGRAVEALAAQFAPAVAVSVTLDPSAPVVPIDAARTRQVLINLVRNAAEAMPEAGGRVEVRTRARGGGRGRRARRRGRRPRRPGGAPLAHLRALPHHEEGRDGSRPRGVQADSGRARREAAPGVVRGGGHAVRPGVPARGAAAA